MNARLTMVEMSEAQLARAQEVAKRLGFSQTAYTSTSAVPGLFCLPDHSQHRHGVLVQTNELGLVWLADMEDPQFHDVAAEQFAEVK